MKNYFKKILKISILSLLTLLFWQCEKENVSDGIENTESTKYTYEINSVNLNELPNLSNHLNNTLKRNIASKNTDENQAIFDVENIMEVIDTLQNKNYSINFSLPDTPSDTFYNLIIEKDSTNVLGTPFVLRYVSDEDNYDVFAENNYNIDYFKGTIHVHKYTDFFDLGAFSRGNTACPRETDQNGEPLACQKKSGSGGAVGGGSSGGSGNAGSGSGFSGWGSGGNGGGGISITYEDCRCHSKHAQGGCTHPIIRIHGYSQRSASSKNASDCPDCNVNTKGGIGYNPDIAYRVRSIVNRLNSQIGLTSEQRIFLNKPENWTTTENINRFWRESEQSEEVKQSLLEGIDNLMTFTPSDYPGKDDGLPFKWWNDEDFIINSGNFDIDDEQPNAKEAALYAIFRKEAVLHIENSLEALSRAKELVADETLTGIGDGKADAFRHAYWNALGTAEFGAGIMKLFADAHEWGENGLSVTMDFHNNHHGRIIGGGFNFLSSDSDIETAVLAALYSGTLKYINSSGFLVPTNM